MRKRCLEGLGGLALLTYRAMALRVVSGRGRVRSSPPFLSLRVISPCLKEISSKRNSADLGGPQPQRGSQVHHGIGPDLCGGGKLQRGKEFFHLLWAQKPGKPSLGKLRRPHQKRGQVPFEDPRFMVEVLQKPSEAMSVALAALVRDVKRRQEGIAVFDLER